MKTVQIKAANRRTKESHNLVLSNEESQDGSLRDPALMCSPFKKLFRYLLPLTVLPLVLTELHHQDTRISTAEARIEDLQVFLQWCHEEPVRIAVGPRDCPTEQLKSTRAGPLDARGIW